MQVTRKFAKVSVVALGVAFACSSLALAAGKRLPGEVQRATPINHVVPEMIIPAGPDFLTTPVGSAQIPVELPANFFFEGSEPLSTMVTLKGRPIGEKQGRKDGFKWVFAVLVEPGEDLGVSHAADPYDTVMVRFQNASLPKIGSQATIDLKLGEVRMDSIEPIVVTGAETKFYTMKLDITPYHPAEGRFERTGWMSFTRDGYGTGSFTAEVYGWGRLTFTPVNGGTSIIHDHDELLTISTMTPTPFVIPALHEASRVAEGGVAAAAAADSIAIRCCGMGSYCVDGGCGWHCPD